MRDNARDMTDIKREGLNGGRSEGILKVIEKFSGSKNFACRKLYDVGRYAF